LSLNDLFLGASTGAGFKATGAASDVGGGAFAQVWTPTSEASLDTTLFNLGRAAASLLGDDRPQKAEMEAFALSYLEALHAADLCFANVARTNLHKARGAFIAPPIETLPDFDSVFQPDEQLPREFRIRVSQRLGGKSYLQWHGVFIGDPLTDNIGDPDGYRFHDIFHFAYAAILHWSPVTRALIKHKRKSIKEYDEAQDSGRAIVVEEGLTAWIFARAKELNFFEGQDRVSLGMLKTIGEFVAGYEVAACPPKLWERAILDGYAVFRQLRDANGGWIVGDRGSRTIRYEALESMD
jgi:MazG C-terminal domain